MNVQKIMILGRSPIIASAFAVYATLAIGQGANTVTINFDEGDGITGEIIDANDAMVRMSTIMGDVTIPLDGVTCIGATCPEAIRLETTDAPVVLTALDGSIKMPGVLLDIEAGQFVLATDIGEIRIDTDKALCEGASCPDPTAEATFAFGGPITLVYGSTTVEGVLMGLEADAYLVDVDVLGTLRVTRDAVCTGSGCPTG